MAWGQSLWRAEVPVGSQAPGRCLTTSDGGVAVGIFDHQRPGVVKLDSNGTLLWTVIFDTAYTDLVRSIVETSDGRLLVLANTNSSTSSTVFSLDANGNQTWQVTYTLPNSTLLSNWICPTHGDGGFLMGGGECTLRRYLLRADSLGNIVFLNENLGIGNSTTGVFFNVIQGAPGRYYATYNSIDTSVAAWGLLQMDETGTTQWATTLHVPVSENVYAMAKSVDGRVAVLSRTPAYAPSYYKMVLSLLDSAGNVLSYNPYAYNNHLELRQICGLQDGGFVMTGTNFGFDAVLLRTDPNGVPIWSRKQNASFNNSSDGVSRSTGDLIYQVGFEYPTGLIVSRLSSLNGDDYCGSVPDTFTLTTQQPAVSHPNVWTVPASLTATPSTIGLTKTVDETIRFCTMTHAAPATATQFRVWPSPFHDHLSLSIPESLGEAELSVYDMQGRQLLSVMLPKQEAQWEFPNAYGLPTGPLLFRLSTNQGTQSLLAIHHR